MASLRVAVLDMSGRPVTTASVTATSRGVVTPVPYVALERVFTRKTLDVGRYTISVSAPRMESQSRDVDLPAAGARAVFVLAAPNVPYFYRGPVKVPFDYPDTYAVALTYASRNEQFADLARAEGVDLAPYGLTPVPTGDSLRGQGVHVFRVAPAQGEKFEQMARERSYVRFAGPVVRQSNNGVGFLTNQIIYRLKPGAPQPDAVLRAGLSAKPIALLEDCWAARGSQIDSLSLLNLCNALATDDKVLWAEPNVFSTVIRHTGVFNPSAAQPHHALIDTPGAWSQGAFGQGVTVAIIDSGCADNFDLPDLSTVVTYNFFAGRTGLDDDEHGTKCAGMVAGAQNATTSHSGIAPQATLVLLERRDGDDVAFADTFLWIAGLANKMTTPIPIAPPPIHVVSCSWDIEVSVDAGHLVEAAFDELEKAGCVVVFSSGDIAQDFSAGAYGAFAAYPTNLAVGSSSLIDTDAVAGDSGVGSELDLVAPGGGAGDGSTESTIPMNLGFQYGAFAQTSCAAPQVAGVAALVMSANPALSPAEVRDILTSTAEKIPKAGPYVSERSTLAGYGRVNANKAVAKARGLATNQ